MNKKFIDANARIGLEEYKAEMGKELGVDIDNIFYAGKVGGVMTRKLVEKGEENLIDEE